LTTQVYFEGDQWLHDDCAGAPKPELVTRLEKHDGPEEIESKGLDRPFYISRFDFRLVADG
jgi:catechol 1,2-dioxygenase